MRFCELFSDYKIRCNNSSKNLLKFIVAMVLIIVYLTSAILYFKYPKIGAPIYIVLCSILFGCSIVMALVYHTKRYQKYVLEKKYRPFSENKHAMLTALLSDYNIDYYDNKQLDNLLELCHSEKVGVFSFNFRPILSKVIWVGFVPFAITLFAKSAKEITAKDAAQIISLIASLLAICFLLYIIIYPIYYFISDGYNFDQFEYDIKQLKVFKKSRALKYSVSNPIP